MKNYRQALFHQIPLKILSFLSLHPYETFYESEIKKITGASIGSTNHTLKFLVDLNIVSKEKKGNLSLYQLNPDNDILKNYRIFNSLIDVNDLVAKVKPYAYEIILYGSCAQGTNTANSDIDLFIKTEHKSKVRKIVTKYRESYEDLKAVILDPLEIAASRKEDEVFYKEVRKGIILWQGRPTYEKF